MATFDNTKHAPAEQTQADGEKSQLEESISRNITNGDILNITLNDQESKKLVSKIDRHILPLMWFVYGIQLTDKSSIGTQATFGLRGDTGLVGQQYAWLTTAFYLSYLVFQLPFMVLLQRFPMGRTLSILVILWGVIVLCIGFAQNFAQLLALRILLGMFECCVSAGFILMIGSWYTTREHASRSLAFTTGDSGFLILANLIMYGLGSISYSHPAQQTWRYMSYFFGGLTIVLGIICLFIMGTPSEVRWLSREEKKMAIERMLVNLTGHDETGMKSWNWKQVHEAVSDPVLYHHWINSFLGAVPNGGLTAFSSIINTSLGFTNLQVILLNIPRYTLIIILLILAAVLTTKKAGMRLFILMAATVTPFIGFFLMSFLPQDPSEKWSRWGAYFMTLTFTVAFYVSWTLIPSNIAGRTKRTMVSSASFVGYCVGNIVGSQIFFAWDAPQYIHGAMGCAVCLCCQFFNAAIWRFVLARRNKKRHLQLQAEGISEEERVARGKVCGEQDHTDKENPYFLYTL